MSDAMLTAYRHDAHKFTGESHEDAREEFAGVPVNQSVPEGADGDAAALSRPLDVQKQTVPTHADHYRLSLLTGETVYDPETFTRTTIESEVSNLIATEDAQAAHERWLASDVAAAFSETVYHPYTSLKFHTLLVAALLDNYRDGHEFADLRLIVDPVGEVVPFRTVFDGDEFALRIDIEDGGRPSARLGSRPWRSWASAWNRLTAHPLDTDHDKYDMTLDANLRRMWSWSTALQYIEDFAAWRPDR
ncbi:hypothetical protein [Haloferax sulfurifontis]|uniref:DUF8168 domain-containing protein n=2 Tax=Haloferax sulfurifontis TaxID=255616 RepID=M0IKL6_9EURY|nr:hypothetical protein [Haloferax sulfurifontis]ELZ96562.1 hypothetical protein C441_04319 [Haloferax sulfurifontis ATCC BAA-897]GGC72855.1 hypothetical protein GCM10007209_38530 [Haloferax sulfurifontis]